MSWVIVVNEVRLLLRFDFALNLRTYFLEELYKVLFVR